MSTTRTPARKKARELATHLRGERPDYAYLREVFRHLREELTITIPRSPKRLPHVPSEEEIRRYYETVWQARRTGDIVLIKTLLYTGVRVSELVRLQIADVDFDRCQVRVTAGKGDKDRIVPFPNAFKETLALHIAAMRARRGNPSVRVVMEEALQRSRGAADPGALRQGGRARRTISRRTSFATSC